MSPDNALNEQSRGATKADAEFNEEEHPRDKGAKFSVPVEAGQAEVSTSAQEQKVANALELATRLTDKQQLLTLQSNAAERGAQEVVEATTARLDELFPQAVKAQRVARARVAVPKNEDVNLLWHAGSDADWEKALSDYDKLLLPANVDVERRLAPRPSMAMALSASKK